MTEDNAHARETATFLRKAGLRVFLYGAGATGNLAEAMKMKTFRTLARSDRPAHVCAGRCEAAVDDAAAAIIARKHGFRARRAG